MRALGLLVLLVGCGGGDGSSCPSFATITGGTFARSGTDLTWTLSVEEISELTFNRAGGSILEYRWGVELDSDRAGGTDLRVAVTYFSKNEPKITTADVLSKTQEDVWAVAASGGAVLVGSATATLANNTFTITTNDSEDSALPNVADASQSTFVTSYFRSLDDNCEDTFKP